MTSKKISIELYHIIIVQVQENLGQTGYSNDFYQTMTLDQKGNSGDLSAAMAKQGRERGVH